MLLTEGGMTSAVEADWDAFSECLDLALALPESERGRWLAALADRDLNLAARVGHVLGASVRKEVAVEPGSNVGPYTIDKLIGRGGMGTVWLAHRSDGILSRSIALKLPHTEAARPRLDGAQLLPRFAREREILAKLSHPNIAHLYDAGIDAHGRPYLAMQFVVGEPFVEYCETRKLGIQQRLRLFLQVLAAVHYAHDQNVIHRDLKPSNILVQQDGTVALLDFGVAKLLVGADPDDSNLTRQGSALLTPNYASPEQTSGEAIGPASDVYSLGVILYELLCGRRPFLMESAARFQADGASLSLTICPPSKVAGLTDAGSAPRTIRGDLDVIVLKALRRDPRDRYPDAAALAEDLRRFMRGETVSARPRSFWYRARKFVRRRRGALPLSASLALAIYLSIWSGGRLWSPQRAAFAPPPHSIAVLPFLNLSGDARQDYLGDGISDELLNELSKLSELQVAARTSSFAFKGRPVDASSIARALNVGAIVEGSVRRDGNLVRITAQLINAVTGFNIWSQTYERRFSDMLNVQTEVATAVAQGLHLKLIGDEASKLAHADTDNAAAYDAYLRGMQLFYRPNTGEAGYRAAADEFAAAAMLDPNYAMAFTRRAAALVKVCMIGTNPNERAALRGQARAAAEQAVEIAPRLGEAHLALALAHDIGVEDRAEAAREYDQALALAPGSAWVQLMYGLFTSLAGHYEVAEAAARKAVELDPQNVDTYKGLGVILVGARRFGEANLIFQQAHALQPESHFVAFYLADNLLALGQFDAARRQCEAPATALDADGRHDCLALAYHGLGRQTDAERQLTEFIARDGDSAAYRYARIYAQWGDRSKAWQWLDKAEQLGDPDLSLLKADWHFDPLRDDARFKAVQARMNYLP
jgi:eukaryotic-like serine/threonine-protein kinase